MHNMYPQITIVSDVSSVLGSHAQPWNSRLAGKWLKFNITIFTIFTLPIIHLVCPRICITIVFDFSGDACNTQEKLETIVMQNFGGGNKVYYGQCERIPPGRRKTIWLFRKLAKVLSWNIPVNKSSCWSEWSSKAAALDYEFSVLTTLSPNSPAIWC